MPVSATSTSRRTAPRVNNRDRKVKLLCKQVLIVCIVSLGIIPRILVSPTQLETFDRFKVSGTGTGFSPRFSPGSLKAGSTPWERLAFCCKMLLRSCFCCAAASTVDPRCVEVERGRSGACVSRPFTHALNSKPYSFSLCRTQVREPNPQIPESRSQTVRKRHDAIECPEGIA